MTGKQFYQQVTMHKAQRPAYAWLANHKVDYNRDQFTQARLGDEAQLPELSHCIYFQ